MGDLDRARSAIAEIHGLIEGGMIVSGMVCISCAKLAGWTIRHAGAINNALPDEAQPTHEGGEP